MLDTAIAAYLLDPAEARYELSHLVESYTRFAAPSDEPAAKGQLDLDGTQADPATSAGRQALAVHHLVEPLLSRLDEQGMAELYRTIENPLVRDFSIRCWRLFSDLDLSEAKKTEFKSLHDCFTRELRPGLRPADPDPSVVCSPSDGIVGAFGRIADTELFQIKGAPYSLLDLLGDPALVEQHRNGRFLTLRLTSSMYHRFHAPHDLTVEAVTYVSGDTWNVNPIALQRIEKLFCKNERAVLRTRLADVDRIRLLMEHDTLRLSVPVVPQGGATPWWRYSRMRETHVLEGEAAVRAAGALLPLVNRNGGSAADQSPLETTHGG